MIKAGRMNESTSLNESIKVRSMTKNDSKGYSGQWQLPSGKPGFIAEGRDVEMACIADEDGIQIILQDMEDNIWAKNYKSNDEATAVAEFKKIAELITDLTDFSKLAKKFGLKSM